MVAFSNFVRLENERREVTHDLLQHARRERTAFGSFASVWFAFNGWMECVTDASTDAAMITAIADNARMTAEYAQLMQDSDFQRNVREFSSRWPVVNVRDARRKFGPDVFLISSREEIIRRCEESDIKMQPVGWTNGETPTWAHVIKSIYMIRCNLFHGAKSPSNLHDRRLVRDSEVILTKFIERSDCFNWND